MLDEKKLLNVTYSVDQQRFLYLCISYLGIHPKLSIEFTSSRLVETSYNKLEGLNLKVFNSSNFESDQYLSKVYILL